MAAAFNFRLTIEGGPPGKAPSEYTIPLGITTIGRVAGNRLVLENEQVSRQHAQIACSLSAAEITDQGSSNGTFVNGEKCLPGVAVVLKDSDVIKIGPFLLTVHAQERIEEPVVPVKAPQPEVKPEEKLPAVEPVPTAPPSIPVEAPEPVPNLVPPGLSIHSQRLIHYLPGIYDPDSRQMDFFSRFLGIFESILTPIEWNVDNFDLFLNPTTAPADFLPWLANWFGIVLQPDWTEIQRREFLQNAGYIFARRGTRAALIRLLEIFTGTAPEIDDLAKDLAPFTFRVRLPKKETKISASQIHALIDAYKPAHTSYTLELI